MRRDGGDDRDHRGDEGEHGDRSAGPGECAGILRGRSRVFLGVHRTRQDRAQQLVLLFECLAKLSDVIRRGCGADLTGRGLRRSRAVTRSPCPGLLVGPRGRRRAAVKGISRVCRCCPRAASTWRLKGRGKAGSRDFAGRIGDHRSAWPSLGPARRPASVARHLARGRSSLDDHDAGHGRLAQYSAHFGCRWPPGHKSGG